MEKGALIRGALWYLFVFTCLFSLTVYVYITFIYGHQPSDISSNTSRGKPFIFKGKSDYATDIASVCATEDYVYVLYGGISTVNAFNHEGEYICTISIHDNGHEGGTTMMACSGNGLLLMHAGDIYAFSNNYFVDYYASKSITYLGRNNLLNRYSFITSYPYYIKSNSIYKQESQTHNYEFLQRQWWVKLLNPKALFCVDIALIAICAIFMKIVRDN